LGRGAFVSRYRAPAGDGETLIDPPTAAVPEWLSRNRAILDSATFAGRTLTVWRRAARDELAPHAGDRPLLLTGHQPELCHPGVWFKTFWLDRTAKLLDAATLNLVVDTDDVKSLVIRVPRPHDDPARVRLDAVPFDIGPASVPYEERPVHDPETFRSFGERTGIDPALWHEAVRHDGTLGDRFVHIRTIREEAWGCVVPRLTVSRLSRSGSFREFATAVLADLPKFAASFNRAVAAYRTRHRLASRTHPFPELRPGEAPFWEARGGERRPARANADPLRLRPRALTLTLYSRLILGDGFVHGIGGGNYDEVTDDLIRDWLGLEPPTIQVVSGTFRLPFEPFPDADVHEATRRLRDLSQNPQRHLGLASPHARAMIDELATWIAASTATKADRRDRRQAIDRLKGMLRIPLDGVRRDRDAALADTSTRAAANAILRRRDYAWVLFPESQLRESVGR
jgi:hypothetical protein